ncbi:MAG TPA: sulfatase [Polyangiales bacterium]|nr:sulfatase [Polyangiales bacterium]
MGRYLVCAWVCAGLLVLGCSKTEPQKNLEQNVATAVAPATAAQPAAPADAPAAETPQAAPDPRNAHLNLQNLVHLADFERGGLFIDFGTPARAKYTVGQWKTGWGKDSKAGETTFTNAASASTRVYLPLRGNEAVALRLRLKPIGTGMLQIYANNTALPAIKLDKGPDWAEYEVKVPAEATRAGENNLNMRWGGVKQVDGEDVAAAVDWMRVLPAAATEAPAPVPYSALVADATVGGQKRAAISLPAGSSLSYYLEIPKGAKLSLRAGATETSGNATVRITPEGGKSKELWKAALGAKWQDQVLPLEAYAGSVVKLDLVADGGNVAFSSPTIMIAQPNTVEVKTQAKSVVVLLIDTLRADRLRAYDKSSRVTTPVLDAFAAEAAVLENAQSPENWTKPSVASVLTGLYPMSHGTKESEAVLADKALMVSEVFKQNGFATASFIANGYVSDKFGFNQGWDFYTNYIRENKSTKAELVFKDAADWVAKNKDKRFFLYVHTIDPHVPYDPPSEFLKMYETEAYSGKVTPRATPDMLEKAKRVPPKVTFDDADRAHLAALYDGEISYHDHYLGVFIDRLKKLGIYDQLVFVVTADHGEEFYDHGSYGHGHSVYQELLHVPFIVRWPGTVGPQRVSNTVSTVDVSPTILSASGIPVPEVMEGTDRIPQLIGALPGAPAAAFSDFLDDRRVVRAGRWKLILRGLIPTFFDLKTDPGEKTELELKSHPIALRYCRILLGQFLGTRDRGDWVSAVPKGKSVELKSEAADMDDATKAGLKALGYAN